MLIKLIKIFYYILKNFLSLFSINYFLYLSLYYIVSISFSAILIQYYNIMICSFSYVMLQFNFGELVSPTPNRRSLFFFPSSHFNNSFHYIKPGILSIYNSFFACKKIFPKIRPPILLCCCKISYVDGGSMAVEIECSCQ